MYASNNHLQTADQPQDKILKRKKLRNQPTLDSRTTTVRKGEQLGDTMIIGDDINGDNTIRKWRTSGNCWPLSLI